MFEIYFFGCLLPSRPFVLGLPIALKVVVKYKASRKEQSGKTNVHVITCLRMVIPRRLCFSYNKVYTIG